MKCAKRNRSRRRVGILLLLLILVIGLETVSAQGGNSITTSGVLTHDETWSGKVHVTGDIVVPEGMTLVIQPGTIITFTPNSSDNDVEIPVLDKLGTDECNVIVEGNVRIEGEKNNRVIIGELVYDVNRQTTMSWGGIVFQGTNASSIIKHSDIGYAYVGVIFTGSSTPRVIDSTIADNGVGIMTFDLSSPVIDGNQIHGSALWGISCYDHSLPMITHNTIEGSEVAIGCEDSSFPIIEYNSFRDNRVAILIQDRSNPALVGNIFSNNTKAIERGQEE